MAAASGSRDGSGPINGTGFGPATGLGALRNSGFCLRRGLFRGRREVAVGVGEFRSRGLLVRWRLLRRGLLGGLLRRCLLGGVRGSLLGGRLLRSLGRRRLRSRCGRFGGRRDRLLGLAPTTVPQLPVRRRRAFRRVDPAGLPSGCSFAAVVVYPAVVPIMPGRICALTGHGQRGRQGQRDGHDRQFEQRPRSRHHCGGAVRTCGG